MPHLDIQYTANIAADTDMTGLCQTLLATLVALRNEADEPVFPLNGTRVMAWPAAHFAVADGQPDRAFIYMNLRIKQGRSDAIKKKQETPYWRRHWPIWSPFLPNTPWA